MGETLRSFADLASKWREAHPGRPLPPEGLMETWDQVEGSLGADAALVFVVLNNRNATKASGPAGSLLMGVGDLMRAAGLPRERVEGAVIALALNGWLSKVLADGRVAA